MTEKHMQFVGFSAAGLCLGLLLGMLLVTGINSKSSVIPAVAPAKEVHIVEMVELDAMGNVLLIDKKTYQRTYVSRKEFYAKKYNFAFGTDPNLVDYQLDDETEARRRIMYDMEIKKRFGIKEEK